MPDPAPGQVWSRANIGEVLPGVVTPLTWDVFLPLLQRAMALRALLPWTLNACWQSQDGQPAQSQLPRLFHGRGYLELGTTFQAFAGLPGVTPRILQRVLGFPLNNLPEEYLPRKTGYAGRLYWARKLFFWGEILGVTPLLPALGWWAGRRAQRDARSVRNTLPRQTLEGLLASAQYLQRRAAPIFALHLSCTAMAFSALGLLHERLCRVLPEDAAVALEATLQSGQAELSSAQFNAVLWDVARAPEAHPIAAQSPAWRRFLERFGARGSDEFELAQPFWDEDPALPVQVIRMMRADHAPDPRAAARQQRTQSRGVLRDALGQVRAARGVPAWLGTRALSNSYARLVGWRETLKHGLICYAHAMRQVYLAAGQLLVAGGQIAAPDDVFFLTQNELHALASQPGASARATVSGRRDQRRADEARPVAELGIWDGEVFSPCVAAPASLSETLRGTPCSPGRVRAAAFVYSDGADASQMPAGCILVMRSADPGRTVLFGRAAGLITEMGGMLSHAATVAREMGLPAVVGVPHALEQIQSGQMLTLDGAAGTVHLCAGQEKEAAGGAD